MNSKRTYIALLGIIGILLILIVGSTYTTVAYLHKQAATLTDLKAKQEALNQQQLNLTQAKKDVAKYSDLLKITKAIVPEDKSQAEAVRQIVAIAEDNQVSLSAITFPASSLGTSTVRPGASGTAPAPTVTSTTGKLSQLTPAKGIPGVYNLTITVQSEKEKPVNYSQFTEFLNALERNRRTAQVNSIILTPDSKNSNQLSFTLTLNEYIKP